MEFPQGHDLGGSGSIPFMQSQGMTKEKDDIGVKRFFLVTCN
jgi:hypothetical protein